MFMPPTMSPMTMFGSLPCHLSCHASHEFQIADDNEILKRLGMHKCRKQVFDVCTSLRSRFVRPSYCVWCMYRNSTSRHGRCESEGNRFVYAWMPLVWPNTRPGICLPRASPCFFVRTFRCCWLGSSYRGYHPRCSAVTMPKALLRLLPPRRLLPPPAPITPRRSHGHV